MEVTLRHQRLRCALCHDEAVGHLVRCRFCGVFMHTECKAEFGRCPSLGCVASAPRLPPLPPPVVIELSELSGEDPSPHPWSLFGRVSPLWVLAAVGTPLLLVLTFCTPVLGPTSRRPSEAALRRAHERAIESAAKLYKVETGRWPARLSQLLGGPKGPYLDGLPRSAGGGPYRFVWGDEQAYLLGEDREGRLVATPADYLGR